MALRQSTPMGPSDSAARVLDVVPRLHDVGDHLALLGDELDACLTVGFALRRHGTVAMSELMHVIEQVRTASAHLAALEETVQALRALGAAQPVSGLYVLRNNQVERKQWFDDEGEISQPSAPEIPFDERPTLAIADPLHTVPLTGKDGAPSLPAL